jgi:antitoxin (DNA-binding transcriptional repressor) of toxin-antitoxin stability system
VIIARAGVPAVRLTPLRRARIPGSAKGEVKIASTFDDPLPDDVVTAMVMSATLHGRAG